MGNLSKRTRWIYGSGNIGFSLTPTIIAAYFAIFLANAVGIHPGMLLPGGILFALVSPRGRERDNKIVPGLGRRREVGAD